jgi:hypothetical protein
LAKGTIDLWSESAGSERERDLEGGREGDREGERERARARARKISLGSGS